MNNSHKSFLQAPGSRRQQNALRPVESNLQKTSLKKASGDKHFKKEVTLKEMKARTLPEIISKRQVSFESEETIGELYNYVLSIAKETFKKATYQQLFPVAFVPAEVSRMSFGSNSSILSRLSTSSTTSAKSLIPVRKNTSLEYKNEDAQNQQEDGKLSLENGFATLNEIVNERPKDALALTDFMILYPSLVVLVCDKENAGMAIKFLDNFIHLEKIKRTDEFNILYTALIKEGNAGKMFKENVVSIIGAAAKISADIKDRIVYDTFSTNDNIRSICNELAEEIGLNKDDIVLFKPIPKDATEKEICKCFNDYIELLGDDILPSSLEDAMTSVTQALLRNKESSSVLLFGSICLELFTDAIDGKNHPPLEVVEAYLSLFFSIQSGEMFLTGEDSTEAQTEIESLLTMTFKKLNVHFLVDVISGLIATSQGEKLLTILERFEDLVKYNENVTQKDIAAVSNVFHAFHPTMKLPDFLSEPDSLQNPMKDIQQSIDKLLNSDDVFKEIDRIVANSKDGNFNQYPSYLVPALEAVYSFDPNEEIEDLETIIEECNKLLSE